MSLFGSIGKSLGGIVSHILPAASAALPLLGTAFGGPGLGAALGGITGTGLLKTGLGIAGGAALGRLLTPSTPRAPIPVGTTGAYSMAAARGTGRGHIGRFSGQLIPRGTKERISSKTGAVILSEVHRGRGLTSHDLRGFRRTIGLLRSVGMVPKRLHVRHHRTRKAA
jgi:hypothetical protein